MGWLRGGSRHPQEPPDHGPGDADLPRLERALPPDFDTIFETYWEPVVRFCFWRLGSWEDAEDAAQNVLFAVAKAVDQFVPRSGSESFRSWVFTLARHETVDEHRKRGRRPEIASSSMVELIDSRPSPEVEAMTSWEHRWLLEQLATLSPDQRAVLELRLVDLTSREIADVLGLGHDNVRKLQQRAEMKLCALADSGIGQTR
jgi:RNA polymerase sigma-70 factor (ECF subfamily)